VVYRDKNGNFVSKGKAAKGYGGTSSHAPVEVGRGGLSARSAAVVYDVEDIDEANRIGAALCRQHAK